MVNIVDVFSVDKFLWSVQNSTILAVYYALDSIVNRVCVCVCSVSFVVCLLCVFRFS